MSAIALRRQQPSDYRAVEELTRDAFWDVYKPGCDEHYVLHKLRKSPAFVPELDYVAVEDGVIVGSIVYSKALITAEDKQTIDVLTFGPFSVAPSHQRKGVGSLLLKHTLAIAKTLPYRGVIIFGEPAYYRRFGFVSASSFGIRPSEGEAIDAFMALPLKDGSLDACSGVLSIDSAFFPDKEAVAAFDATFPPREKHVLPTQLFRE